MWWKILSVFCWKFYAFSRSEKTVKICQDFTKLQLVTKRFHFFPDTCVVSTLKYAKASTCDFLCQRTSCFVAYCKTVCMHCVQFDVINSCIFVYFCISCLWISSNFIIYISMEINMSFYNITNCPMRASMIHTTSSGIKQHNCHHYHTLVTAYRPLTTELRYLMTFRCWVGWCCCDLPLPTSNRTRGKWQWYRILDSWPHDTCHSYRTLKDSWRRWGGGAWRRDVPLPSVIFFQYFIKNSVFWSILMTKCASHVYTCIAYFHFNQYKPTSYNYARVKSSC